MDEAIRGEAEEAFRALVEGVVLTPDDTAPDRLAAEIHGDLAVILRLGDGSLKTQTPPSFGGRRTSVLGSQFSGDAGTGFEPVTFRL